MVEFDVPTYARISHIQWNGQLINKQQIECVYNSISGVKAKKKKTLLGPRKRIRKGDDTNKARKWNRKRSKTNSNQTWKAFLSSNVYHPRQLFPSSPLLLTC